MSTGKMIGLLIVHQIPLASLTFENFIFYYTVKFIMTTRFWEYSCKITFAVFMTNVFEKEKVFNYHDTYLKVHKQSPGGVI